MPIYANKEAHAFWTNLPATVRSRSLAATHFAFIGESRADKEWRKQACDQIQSAQSHPTKRGSHQGFLNSLIEQGAATVYGKLEARLILNAGDGIIENGGICLDRNSGLPYIPGSAIKAAARRYAIQVLGDAQTNDEKAKILARIALTFGYGNTEWKAGRDSNHGHSHSDFWLAMHPLSEPGSEYDSLRDTAWQTVSEKAAGILFSTLNIKPADDNSPLAVQLPNLSGSIHYLPAYPTNSAKVVTDVLTPHHTEYYAGKTKVTATDDESPIPIFFPVVDKGTSYQFVLSKGNLPHAAHCLEEAKHWLTQAITILGIGAKTNAGYGWFTIDASAQHKADTQREDAEAEKVRIEILESLSPEARAQEELKELTHEEFVEVIKNLKDEDSSQQKIVCDMLASSEKEQWKKWKKQKKGNWVERVPKIRDIAKSHGIELS